MKDGFSQAPIFVARGKKAASSRGKKEKRKEKRWAADPHYSNLKNQMLKGGRRKEKSKRKRKRREKMKSSKKVPSWRLLILSSTKKERKKRSPEKKKGKGPCRLPLEFAVSNAPEHMKGGGRKGERGRSTWKEERCEIPPSDWTGKKREKRGLERERRKVFVTG